MGACKAVNPKVMACLTAAMYACRVLAKQAPHVEVVSCLWSTSSTLGEHVRANLGAVYF